MNEVKSSKVYLTTEDIFDLLRHTSIDRIVFIGNSKVRFVSNLLVERTMGTIDYINDFGIHGTIISNNYLSVSFDNKCSVFKKELSEEEWKEYYQILEDLKAKWIQRGF